MNYKDHFVYGLIDPRTDELFYIGKGRGTRARSHARPSFYNNPKFKKMALYEKVREIIVDDGLMYGIEMFHEGLTEKQALKLEVQIIRKEMSKYNCTILNKHAEMGRVYSKEEREHRSSLMTNRMKKWHAEPSNWLECKHCQKKFTIGNYTRWHGDKCKKAESA